MQRKTLIAVAVAGLLAAPLALAQYDKDRSVSSPAPGSASSSSSSNVTGKANEEKGSPSASASSSTGNSSIRGDTSTGMTGMGAQISSSEFRKMDKNHDGYLSKDEVKDNSSLSSSFDQLDKNHDGKLARSEVTSGASASASDTGTSGSSKRGAERISRNDRGTGSDSADQTPPNMPKNPQSGGNPPKGPGTKAD
jgi:EF hand domain-containing protein